MRRQRPPIVDFAERMRSRRALWTVDLGARAALNRQTVVPERKQVPENATFRVSRHSFQRSYIVLIGDAIALNEVRHGSLRVVHRTADHISAHHAGGYEQSLYSKEPVPPTMLETAIIGAGPYGLSIAAHLRGSGIPFRIFGRPMDSRWAHMPEGMLLKSDGFASNIDDPRGEYTLGHFCKERGMAYGAR